MLEDLQRYIGYHFKNDAMLKQALTHASLSRQANNQRLEFLGDAVLGLIVSEMLYNRFPKENEGALAKRKGSLVSGRTVSAVAEAIGLAECLRMTGGEAQTGGRQNASNLEDACEALIGAIYLDGGLEPAKKFILTQWEKRLEDDITPPKDPKSTLQEWAQGRKLPLPVYETIDSTGPSHAPQFTVRVSLPGMAALEATAASKRIAEQMAATLMMQQVTASQQQ